MLLDSFMPESDMRVAYSTRIAAPPALVYACLWTWTANFDHWGLTRALYALRALPSLAATPHETWHRVRAELGPRRVTLQDVLARGFTLLAERPGEELVLGTVGRFWHGGGETRPVSPALFREPVPPGTAKAAWNFAVRRGPGGGTELRTETRVLSADAATRRRFRAYWLVIRPFSGSIRREMLAAVRSAAEANPPPR